MIERLMAGALVCLFVAVASPSAAQTAPPPSATEGEELSKLSLDEILDMVVTSASKVSQLTREAPSVVSIIPRSHIDSYGWTSVDDILGVQPGFAPSQDYDRRTVSSRGLYEGWNNNHLLLLVDGVPFNDNLYGTAYTWEITPLALMKSVEVLRGPGSALYGSNATNGAVNLTTISADDLYGSVAGRMMIGEEGTRIFDAVAGSSQPGFSAVFGYNSNRTDGNEYLSTDGSGRTAPDGALALFETRDSRKNDYFFAKLEGKGRLEGLSMQFHEQRWDFETGHGWIFLIPDFDESMSEDRQILSLKYKLGDEKRLAQEYVVRYQRHQIDWNQRYFPNDSEDAYGTEYPAGLWEYLDTEAEEYFGRAQVTVGLPKSSNIVAGLESTIFLYGGDNEHASNVNINFGDDYTPVEGNRFKPLNAWLQWIEDEPVTNIGGFAQWSSGRMLGEELTATVGGRYDRQSFDFNALDVEGTPTEHKSFSQFSPRVALVYSATRDLTLKLLAGRAFRAPAPTELFGANTYSLASNLRQLEPEEVSTFELAGEWRAAREVLLRISAFHTEAENQIAYSVANANLSTNIYSLTTAGVEGELLLGGQSWSAFANYSYAQRLEEEILDPTISESDDLTWAPAHVANVGGIYDPGRWSLAGTLHYQGDVKRRDSDRGVALFNSYRDPEVGSWFTIDMNFVYRFTPKIEFRIRGTNLLDDDDEFLLKNQSFPFDYRIEGRRVTAGFGIGL